MAAKSALLISGSFVLALLQIGPGASQEIPDGKVYTDLKKTLVNGSSGILTCRFTGPPYAVFWKKGHDPWTSPTVMTWTPESKTGPRYEDGSCDMTENYSLVIKTVKYTDAGRYICFVSNQHGILIDNYTDITVTDVGVQTEPEISLEKGLAGILPCKLNVQPKVVMWKKGPTYSSAKILVAIDKYHNVGKISGPGYEEGMFDITADYSLVIGYVDNEDGGQYFCDLLEVDTDNTFQDFTYVTVFGIVRGMTKGDRSTYQEDPVAHVELWKLVEYASIHKELDILGDAIAILCSDGNESPRATTKDEYYNGLCRWKDACKKRKQRTRLYDTFYQNGLRKSLANLRDFRGTVTTEICQFDLEHILWEIGEQDEIMKFLVSLKIDPPGRPGEAETSLTIFHQQALVKLIRWTRGNLDINPVIILSSTLEKLNHESANNFFRVPDEEKQGLEDNVYQRYARYFSKHHGVMLATIIESSTNTLITVIKTLEENWETLFNTEKMLRDWWKEQECSNYKRRCILAATRHAQQKPGKSDEQWPSDEELKLIAHYLDQKSTKPVSERLGMSDLSESADEENKFEALCAWRQLNKGEWTTLHVELLSALKNTNISGLLSPLRNDAVHKVEVVDIAFNLLMTDILPLARRLGVCEAKLSSYRPVFEPSHLTKGTIGLVSTLVSLLDENNQREELWRKLREGGFSSTIQRKLIAFKMSYGELSAISNAVMRSGTRSEENSNTAQEVSQQYEGDPLLGTKEVVSPDTTKVPIEPDVVKAKEFSQHFNIIKKMLTLTDKEVAAGSSVTDTQDEFTLFKIWKGKPRLSAFNYRAAVIEFLHDFGKSDIARSVMEGKYKAEAKSLSFIMHMVQKVITDGRLERLAEALNLQKNLPGAQRSDDDISETICERMRFLKHAPGVCNQRVKERDRKRSRNHDLQVCQFDKLVDHGFLDLARELLIIDQQ